MQSRTFFGRPVMFTSGLAVLVLSVILLASRGSAAAADGGRVLRADEMAAVFGDATTTLYCQLSQQCNQGFYTAADKTCYRCGSNATPKRKVCCYYGVVTYSCDPTPSTTVACDQQNYMSAATVDTK